MEWTGERYLPTLPDPDISYEHWHRYLHASGFVSGKAVLDVASGEGYGSHLLAQSARRVVGVDRCAEAVRHASAQYARPNLEFLQGDAGAIPIPGEQLFDVALSFETIEHLDAEGQGRFLGEVKRLLRPEGVFLVSTPNKLLYTDRLSFHNEFHLCEFHLPEFKQFLARYFRHADYLGQKVYPISYLWPLDRPGGANQEYQIGYANGCYGPMADDAKEVLYVLAVCSDTPLDLPGGSLALDVTGQAIYQRTVQAEEKERRNQALTAALSQTRAEAEAKDRQNQSLMATLGQTRAEAEAKDRQNQSLMATLGQMRAEAEEKRQQNRTLTEALGQARGQLEEYGRQLQSFRAELEQSRTHLDAKESQVQGLTAALVQAGEGAATVRERGRCTAQEPLPNGRGSLAGAGKPRSRTVFERLAWHEDHALLDQWVFRLQHKVGGAWQREGGHFLFYKVKELVDQFQRFWTLRPRFRPRHVFEIGIWDGGSVVFWFEQFRPRKHVAIDIQPKQDSDYFQHYVRSKGLEDRIHTHWGVDQADAPRLRQLVAEMPGPLDLVIDDASHLYAPTRASFEALFPLLRPGGLYLIEDWAWGHWSDFLRPEHPWAKETPLTRLVCELVEAAGTSTALLASLSIHQGFAVIERGPAPLDQTFRLEQFIRHRDAPAL